MEIYITHIFVHRMISKSAERVSLRLMISTDLMRSPENHIMISALGWDGESILRICL